jgi:ABC-type lipoprotein export system ATPase subunit
VLIADEPTGNLDSKTADSVFELFHDLAAQGKSVVIVTHDGSLASRTHRTIPIVDGEIVEPAMAQPFYSPAIVGD